MPRGDGHTATRRAIKIHDRRITLRLRHLRQNLLAYSKACSIPGHCATFPMISNGQNKKDQNIGMIYQVVSLLTLKAFDLW